MSYDSDGRGSSSGNFNTIRTSPDNWLVQFKKRPDARIRLFCFPYVGGGSTVYFHWSKFFSDDVEVCAIRLPGRENRINEKPFTRMPALVEVLADVLLPMLDRPFVFFGHSMGSRICYELACLLRSKSLPEPEHLFVSGARAPHHPSPKLLPYYKLPDQEFIEKLKKLNGIPKQIFQAPDLAKLFLPVLRADAELYMTYVYQPSPPLSCPITAYGGEDDPVAEYREIESWREYTQDSFEMHILPGDHFFINTSRDRLLALLSLEIDKTTGFAGF